MNGVIYVVNNTDISIFHQHNVCAEYAKKYGISVSYRVFDIRGNRFQEAINKVIADENNTALIVYNRDVAFNDFEEYLFYKIYLEKLNKKLISCT